MPDTPTLPDWLYPGAKVASFTLAGGSYRDSVRLGVVERIGKRDVVLDNEERFNVHSLSRDAGGTWGPTVYLRPRNDPDVRRCLAHQRRRAATANATKLLGVWVESGDPAQAEKAIAAIRRVVEAP